MNLLKNKYFQLGLALTCGIVLSKLLFKSADKKTEVLESLDTPEEELVNFSGPISTPAPSTTPVSGTSDSILHQINEDEANNLKHELK